MVVPAVKHRIQQFNARALREQSTIFGSHRRKAPADGLTGLNLIRLRKFSKGYRTI